MMIHKPFWAFAIFSLFLTACGSNPQSYLPAKSTPIVNIEATIEPQLDVKAEAGTLTVSNKSAQPLNLAYKLFWYDKHGVTQTTETDHAPWLNLWLPPQQTQGIALQKPTEESTNYRVYLRGSR